MTDWICPPELKQLVPRIVQPVSSLQGDLLTFGFMVIVLIVCVTAATASQIFTSERLKTSGLPLTGTIYSLRAPNNPRGDQGNLDRGFQLHSARGWYRRRHRHTPLPIS